MINFSEQQKSAMSRIYHPIDDMGLAEAREVMDFLIPTGCGVKLGKEIITNSGLEPVYMAKERGLKIFLDLKYHDIPNTVKNAVREASNLGIDLVNVHGQDYRMMKAAMQGIIESNSVSKPKVLGVTVLTSIDEMSYIHDQLPLLDSISGDHSDWDSLDKLLNFDYHSALDLDLEIKTSKDDENKIEKLKNIFKENFKQPFENLVEDLNLGKILQEQVVHRAKNAYSAGLDGVVCSPLEVEGIYSVLPRDFVTVTPGISKPSGEVGSDQKRVATPSGAINNGASYLVIGRGMKKSSGANPYENVELIANDLVNNTEIFK